MLRSSVLVLSSFLAIGCNHETGAPKPGLPNSPTTLNPTTGTTTTGTNKPGTPTNGTSSSPSGTTYAGLFQIDTQLDVLQSSLVPSSVQSATTWLSEFSEDPGLALADLAKQGGILPDSTGTWGSAILGALIDSQIPKGALSGLSSVGQEITGLPGAIDLVGKFTVHTPASNGAITVELQLTDSKFQSIGNSVSVPIPVASLAAAHISMNGTFTAAGDGQADAQVSLDGSPTLTLPLGDLIIEAAVQLILQPLTGQTDFVTALQQIANCAALPTDDPIGLGLSAAQMCDNVIAHWTNVMLSQLRADLLLTLTFDNGTFHLKDMTSDKPTIDQISDGVVGEWKWSVAGPGGASGPTVDLTPTFAGNRIGSAL